MISQKAQVLVEFAIATVGVLVLAFICGRVAVWLNESLVERNASYQQSRVQAGEYGKLQKEGDPITTFDAPADIHLVGKEAEFLLGKEPQKTVPPTADDLQNGVQPKPGDPLSATIRTDCESLGLWEDPMLQEYR